MTLPKHRTVSDRYEQSAIEALQKQYQHIQSNMEAKENSQKEDQKQMLAQSEL